MDVRRVIGENVRRIRLAEDVSQEALAVRMGVDRAYISSLELGQRNITVISLWRVAEALGVPANTLLIEDDKPSSPSGSHSRRATKQVK